MTVECCFEQYNKKLYNCDSLVCYSHYNTYVYDRKSCQNKKKCDIFFSRGGHTGGYKVKGHEYIVKPYIDSIDRSKRLWYRAQTI